MDALNDLVKDLLLFARPPKPRPRSVEVLPLISSTADLLAQHPALKNLRIDLEGSAPPISADPKMLRIVFQNLLMNGAHAMQGRGAIQVGIRANRCDLPDRILGQRSLPSRRWSCSTAHAAVVSHGIPVSRTETIDTRRSSSDGKNLWRRGILGSQTIRGIGQ